MRFIARIVEQRPRRLQPVTAWHEGVRVVRPTGSRAESRSAVSMRLAPASVPRQPLSIVDRIVIATPKEEADDFYG